MDAWRLDQMDTADEEPSVDMVNNDIAPSYHMDGRSVVDRQ